MEWMNLDTLIQRKENQALKNQTLDDVGFEQNKDLDPQVAIYDSIFEEALCLKEKGKYKYKSHGKSHTISGLTWCANLKTKLKSLDRRLQSYSFYNLYIRRFLLKLKNKMYEYRNSINLWKLLKMSDQDYVAGLYLKIYDRKPEEEGMEHNLQLLQQGKVRRLEMFDAFYNSEDNRWPKRVRWNRLARVLYKNK